MPTCHLHYLEFLFFDDVKALNAGVHIGDSQVSILLYADDIVLVSETADGLQSVLDKVDEWSVKWRVKFNNKKSNVVHFRKPYIPHTNHTFILGDAHLDIVHQYKYLGIICNEYLDFNVTAKALADAGSRALGAVINKYVSINGLGYYTFSKIYQSGVCPILDYCGEIWGFQDYAVINSVQNKAMRIYLGVHRFASNAAVSGDMGWTFPFNQA